jgi:hypothetical protein
MFCFIADLIFFFFVPAQRAPTLSAYGACEKARDSFSIVPMEFAMAGHDIREQHYPMVEFVLDAIAGWINIIVTCMECEMSWGNAVRKM